MFLLALVLCATAHFTSAVMNRASEEEAATVVVFRELRYALEGQQFRSFVAFGQDWDMSEPRPTIAILPDWDGLNQYEKERAVLIVQELGYVAVGIDIFGADNLNVKEIPDRIALVTKFLSDPELYKTHIELGLGAACDYGPMIDANRIALYGYCFGGSGALLYAALGGHVSAAVAFHPSVNAALHPRDGVDIVTPTLVLTGASDNVANIASTLELESALTASEALFEIKRYGHIGHGFTSWSSGAYDARVDSRSWLSAHQFVDALFREDDTLESTALRQRAMGSRGGKGGVEHKKVYYEHAGEALTGYIYFNSAWQKSDAKRPGVIVVHDANGIDEYEHTRAHMLVEAGFYAMVVPVYDNDLQRRIGVLNRNTRIGILNEWRGDADRLVRRLLAGVEEFCKTPGLDAKNLGAIGFCFGGTAVLDMALNEPTSDEVNALNVKAIASFHGGLGLRANGTKPIHQYVTAYMGSLDEEVEQVESLEHELTMREAPGFEIVRYSDTPHAFTVWTGTRYRPRADARSWASALDYLTAALGKQHEGTAQPVDFVDILMGGEGMKFSCAKDLIEFAKKLVKESVHQSDLVALGINKEKLDDQCYNDMAPNVMEYHYCWKMVDTVFREGATAVREKLDMPVDNDDLYGWGDDFEGVEEKLHDRLHEIHDAIKQRQANRARRAHLERLERHADPDDDDDHGWNKHHKHHHVAHHKKKKHSSDDDDDDSSSSSSSSSSSVAPRAPINIVLVPSPQVVQVAPQQQQQQVLHVVDTVDTFC